MNLTKGQIMMIHNMVNCELSNKNTVYSITELVNLKEQLTLTDVVHSGFYCMDAENSNGSCHCPKQCNSCVVY